MSGSLKEFGLYGIYEYDIIRSVFVYSANVHPLLTSNILALRSYILIKSWYSWNSRLSSSSIAILGYGYIARFAEETKIGIIFLLGIVLCSLIVIGSIQYITHFVDYFNKHLYLYLIFVCNE